MNDSDEADFASLEGDGSQNLGEMMKPSECQSHFAKSVNRLNHMNELSLSQIADNQPDQRESSFENQPAAATADFSTTMQQEKNQISRESKERIGRESPGLGRKNKFHSH